MVETDHRAPFPRRNELGQVANWLVKIVVVLLVVGLVVIEAGGVIAARLTVSDAANNAAKDAAFAIKTRGIQVDPEEAARERAKTEGAEFVSIAYDQVAQTVTVTLRRKARTVVIQNIGPLKKYTVAQASSTRSYAGP